MVRRIITVAAIALAVAGGARLSVAQPRQDSPPNPAKGETPPPPRSDNDEPPSLLGSEKPQDRARDDNDDPPPLGKAAKRPPKTKDEESPAPIGGSERPNSRLGGFQGRTAKKADPSEGDTKDIPRPAPALPDQDGALDPSVEPTQAPGGAGEALPPAREKPGASGAAASGAPADPYVLPAENLKPGPSSANVSVEVRAEPSANLLVPFWVSLIVRNDGETPAMGVVLRYPVPDGMDVLDPLPPQTNRLGDAMLAWQLNTIAAGGQKVVKLKLRPNKAVDVVHAATVQVLAGSRASTRVKQPKLKVEMQANAQEVRKGRSVRFDISVSNTGNGPARDVVITATLGRGLRYGEEGQVLRIALKDIGKDPLQPNQTVSLEPLIVDTVDGAEAASCDVIATSRDVLPGAPEAHSVVAVKVVEPKLAMKISGPAVRHPDTVGRYAITVANNGSATAHHVRFGAHLPLDGTPTKFGGGKWDSSKRWIIWDVGDLEPGKTRDVEFLVRMGRVGRFPVEAKVVADTITTELKDAVNTEITGMADVRYSIVEQRRVIDVGEETEFEIRLENDGSKEADKVLVTVGVSENLEVTGSSGTETAAVSSAPQDRRDATFPVIANLAPGAKQTLTVRVKAKAPGPGNINVLVTHDEIKVPKSESVRVARGADSTAR